MVHHFAKKALEAIIKKRYFNLDCKNERMTVCGKTESSSNIVHLIGVNFAADPTGPLKTNCQNCIKILKENGI